mgnify:CR=1 FL=1
MAETTGAHPPVGRRPGAGRGDAPAYAELHCHSNFSFLDGASDPEAMAETAAALGLRGLAITDHDSLSGIVRFGAAAQVHGVHPITGIELSVEPPLARSLTVTRISPHDQPAPRLALLGAMCWLVCECTS